MRVQTIQETINLGLQLVPKFQVMTIKTRSNKPVIEAISNYANTNMSTCMVIDLEKNKLSDAIRFDGVNERFFVAMDAEWIRMANIHFAHLVFTNVDGLDHEDKYLLDSIVRYYNTPAAFGTTKSPLNSTRVIILHKNALDFSNRSNDKLFPISM